MGHFHRRSAAPSIAAILVIALSTPAGSAAATTTTAPASAPQHSLAAAAAGGVPRPDHVVIVVEENHSALNILGNPDAPYINALAAANANMTSMFAEAHPSQPNYIAMFAGDTLGVTDDACPQNFTNDNLGSQLIAAGLSFAGYSEGLPSTGYAGCVSGKYARKHNPWSDFTNVPAGVNLPMTSFPTDFSQLPTVSFVVPNLVNDMHDGTVAQGDAWLAANLDPYVQWAKTHNSLFVLTFDEDDYRAGNQIATVIAGQQVQPGSYPETINHYNILRTVQDAYGLPPLANSVTAAPLLDIWAPGGGNQPPTATFTTTISGLRVAVDASGSSDPDGSISSYAWDFGDGSSGSGSTAARTYATAGTYQIALTVTDNGGATRTTTRTVSVTSDAMVVAADGYARTTTNTWGTADVGGAWSASGTPYSVSSGVGRVKLNAGSGPTITLNGVSAADVDEQLEISPDKDASGGGLYVSLVGRRTSGGDYRAKARLVAGGGVQLYLTKLVGSTETTLQGVTVAGLSARAGDRFTLRLRVVGSAPALLNARIWATGTTEPTAWQASATDSTISGPGTVAVVPYVSSTTTNAPVSYTVDNFRAVNPSAVPAN